MYFIQLDYGTLDGLKHNDGTLLTDTVTKVSHRIAH